MNKLIYDIGMHLGEDTEFYLNKGYSVIAFEADPDHVNFCKNKFREHIDNKRLVIVEGAIVISDKSKISFYKNINVSVWGTVHKKWYKRNNNLGSRSIEIEVDVVDFEAKIKEYGIPHYMKIDIEGSDVICLEVLKKFLEKPEYISIESDKTSFMNLKKEFDLLEDLGYGRFQVIEQSGFKNGSSGTFGTELPDSWKSRWVTILIYRFIFLRYFLFGDNGKLRAYKSIRKWYDTHARLSKLI